MGNLYNLNKMNPAANDYGLGTELNKIYADLTEHNTQINNSKNFVVNAAGLAIGTADLKYRITNAFSFFIDGVLYTKAAANSVTVVGTGLTCATSKYAAYLVEINAGGTCSLQKAADATSQAAALAALADVTPAATKAPVGVIHVQNSAGAAFIPGATAAGAGDFADDTTADSYIDFVKVSAADLRGEYTQTFAVIT